jgi:outer membrane protein OmpA-like peptidoglycan-associated protein
MIHRASQGAAIFRATRPAVLLALALTAPAAALDLALPEGATIVAATPPGPATHVIATGPWDGSRVPLRTVSGTVRAAAWQVPVESDLSIDAVVAGIERQLRDQGYVIDLTCADRACGGFDFRRQLDMGQSPEMHVDIGNFRYLAATGEQEGDRRRHRLARRPDDLRPCRACRRYRSGRDMGHPVEPHAARESPTPVPARPVVTDPPPAIARLAEFGAVPLDDLRFRTGASDLSGDSYPSLLALAAFLAENPDRRVVLVGHTDAEGGRDSNIALSEARAEAVRRHLIDQLGVNPAQLDAAGIGYLAPRATNETAGGREANRRVEVVLLDAG